jgi:glycosyltransferase involved in cell wall biosynthesis
LTTGGRKNELLVLCQVFYPELISTGQVLTDLCEALAERGMSIEVICGIPTILPGTARVARRIDYEGMRIRRVWGTRFAKLNVAGRICNQLTFTASAFIYVMLRNRGRPVLVLTDPPFLALSCAVLRTFGRCGPYACVVFDVYPDTAVRASVLRSGGLVHRIWERLNGFILKHASAVIVLGRCMAEVMRGKLQRLGASHVGKMRRIHMWCNEAQIARRDTAISSLRSAWNLAGKFVVGYFGNMGRVHDIETIMAAARILRDNKDTVFLFVGEGHKKSWAMAYAAGANLPNCQFRSYVAREALGALLATADIGLVSLMSGHEGLSVPSKAFGLMAAGVAVVAIMGQTSEIARVVAEEDCGVVVAPNDAESLVRSIVELREDADRRRRMGANGRIAIADKYSLRSAADAYSDLVSSLA